MKIIRLNDLPPGGTSWQFEGYRHGDVNVSFFINETQPGRGPSLHKHPYRELFLLLDGHLTCWVGEEIVEMAGGEIVIVPPEAPHKFVNSGTGVARHVDIHTSLRMITQWLED